MKPLYWTKIALPGVIPVQNNDSLIWDKVADVEVDTIEMEELFSKPDPKAKVKAEQPKPEAVSKKPAKFIDSKKSQAVGILQRSSKLDVASLEEIVMKGEFGGEMETLTSLHQQLATPEELELMNCHQGSNPDQPMDEPDLFLHGISKIDKVSLRLECMIFRGTFMDKISEAENKLLNIRSCCEALSDGQDLLDVLSHILACGNYLNGGNKQRGQADGFNIDVLPKVQDVKTKTNDGNLLSYIVKCYIRNHDEKAGTLEAKLPVPEPGDLEKCRNVDFEQEKVTVDGLRKDVTVARGKLRKINSTCNEEDKEPFNSVMDGFQERAEEEVSKLELLMVEAKSKFTRCMTSYKFAPKKGKLEDAKPEEFFDIWYKFTDEFKNIWKKEQRRIEDMKAKEARKKAAEKKTVEVETKKSTAGGIKDKVQKRKDVRRSTSTSFMKGAEEIKEESKTKTLTKNAVSLVLLT